MSHDSAAYAAGLAQGRQDAGDRVSSMTPPAYEGNQDFADGYATGFAQASDPGAYAEGEQAGRSDTIHHVSSLPPTAYDPTTHYDYPGTQVDSYNKGYEEGAAAPPYLSDVEAQQAAEQAAREQAERSSWPSITPSLMQPQPGQSSQQTMSPITEEQEEADKRYTEEKEATERYLHLRDDWEDELKRTTPEDVTGQPLAE
ncbi:MAG TPA: hypothetical protein VHB98_17630 [Chloroflexota bacterium]|nr:hypothetical protein [Chloroflexota bacterium]